MNKLLRHTLRLSHRYPEAIMVYHALLGFLWLIFMQSEVPERTALLHVIAAIGLLHASLGGLLLTLAAFRMPEREKRPMIRQGYYLLIACWAVCCIAVQQFSL